MTGPPEEPFLPGGLGLGPQGSLPFSSEGNRTTGGAVLVGRAHLQLVFRP